MTNRERASIQSTVDNCLVSKCLAAFLLLLGHDQRFFLRQSVQGGLIKMQVSGHQLGRGVRQPFGGARSW